MSARLLAVCAAMIAGTATAQSCPEPNVMDAFRTAAASKTQFYVVRGQFSYPEETNVETQVPLSFDATFKGHVLTDKGFTDEVDVPLVIDLICKDGSCGTLSDTATYLAFIDQRAENVGLVSDPCGLFVFADPAQTDIDALEACASGNCPEPSSP